MVTPLTLPRVAIAAPTSGAGKTTVATGLMRAFRDEGLTVSPHKVGPDYIDPGWHTVATGNPGRNLDPMLQGHHSIAPLLRYGAETLAGQASAHTADIAIIEGAMGLFDGAIGRDGYASTAHIATLTKTPIILTVDAGRTARSLAATVHGFATFDPQVHIAGVIVNNVATHRQEREIRAALNAVGVPLLGVIPRSPHVVVTSRHLGLVTAAEYEDAASHVEAMGQLVAQHLNLSDILKIAHTAPAIDAQPWQPPPLQPTAHQKNIVFFGGKAFTFGYREHVEMIQATGARVTVIDPLVDQELPADTSGLVIGGGFPECHLPDLAAATTLKREVAEAVTDGVPTYAECAGYTYLCTELDGHPMCGVVPATATMTKRLTMGYRHAVAAADSVWHREGQRVIGHEFHRTNITYARHQHPTSRCAYQWQVDSADVSRDGFVSSSCVASYLHQHWASHQDQVVGFVS